MERIKACASHCRDAETREFLEIASRAALEAGALLKELYARPHQISHKGRIDLVTEADVASEEHILSILRASCPEVAIFAEESHGEAALAPPSGAAWIVDPLDGTTNFAHGYPWFGISVAFARGARVEVGVIYCPMQDELYAACRGAGAWLNGQGIHTSQAQNLSDSLLATGFPYDIQQSADQVLGALGTVIQKAQGIRRAGAAALDLAAVACGRLDGFWEIKLKPWDTAAGLVLVEEAGGRFSNFRGGPYSPFIPEILGSNGLIHEELAALLKDFSGQP